MLGLFRPDPCGQVTEEKNGRKLQKRRGEVERDHKAALARSGHTTASTSRDVWSCVWDRGRA